MRMGTDIGECDVMDQGVEGAPGPSRLQGSGRRGQGLSLKLGTGRAHGAAEKVWSHPENRKDCCAGAEGSGDPSFIPAVHCSVT